MERFDANVSSLNAPLQEAPEVFEGVGVDVSANVFHGMVNNLMEEFCFESLITRERIAVQSGACQDVCLNQSLESIAFAVGNNLGADFSTTLNESQYWGFVFSASARDFLFPLVFVHVASKATDESLINFDFTAKHPTVLILQGKPDTVHHEPSGFLSYAKATTDFITADAVLVVGDHPHCGEPLVEADRGILKDSANLDGELPLGVVAGALPHTAARIEFDALGAAVGADHHAIRPALGNHLPQAIVGVGIEEDCFLKGLGFAHVFVLHKRNTTPNKWMSQVICCPNLSLVRLMHDHTGNFGTAIDLVNTPETQQADNDYAVGLLVQKVAGSIYANNTLIFVIEDDAQDGADHVDSHRTIAFVAGAYVKQGAVVSTLYNTLNFVRTMEEVMGIPQLNLNDTLARPMADVFNTTPSPWSFTATPSSYLYNTTLPLPPKTAGLRVPKSTHNAKYWARATRGLDFSDADLVDPAVYNRILWKGMMGNRPYPVASSGPDVKKDREELNEKHAGSPKTKAALKPDADDR